MIRIRPPAAGGLIATLLVCATVVIVAAGCGSGDSTGAAGDARTIPAKSASGVSPRIIGGQAAAKGAWPFATFITLHIDEDGDGQPDKGPDGSIDGAFCGGSLIGERWVLTAGHCLADVLDAKLWIGDEQRPFKTAAYTASQADGDFWTHPDYDPGVLENDIALIRLDRAAPQQAVSLVLADDDSFWSPPTMATVIGWGRQTRLPGSDSDVLREAQVPVLSDAACTDAFKTALGPVFDAKSMVCAGGGEISPCFGDSGGPIMVPFGSRWLQFGIVSHGGPAGCAAKGSPGVFSRLEVLSGSALSHIESDSESPASASSVELGDAEPARDSVTLNGTVQTRGLGTWVFFELRLSSAAEYDRGATGYVAADTGSHEMSAEFKGLQPGTEYTYRVSSDDSTGVTTSEEKRFTTSS